MCRFKSAIITKERLLCENGIDSHQEIIKKYRLKDKDSANPSFVRIEYLPDWTDFYDFSKWKFKVDQDILPDWWDAEWAKKEMGLWVKKNYRKGRKINDFIDLS